MSAEGCIRENYRDGKKHRDKVHEKYLKIEGLKALIATHEAAFNPDVDYLRELKAKLVGARNQLKAMIGANDEGT